MNIEDEKYMRKALEEARVALSLGEVPIGAVIVARGAVIGKGHNLVERLHDATAHAEMQAITAACETLGGKYLTDCTLYVTVEPCAMCAGAIAWSQVSRVVFGAEDAKRGYRFYSSDIIHRKVEVLGGVLAEDCEALMREFFVKIRG